MKDLRTDCRHFSGDRPCRFHKNFGIKCHFCEHYSPIDKKVLIIKLGAPGDVLRTTAILPEIKRQEPRSHITWITQNQSLPLLENNPYIDRLWVYSVEAANRLYLEEFDLVLSLDNSGDCASIASLSWGKTKRGFGLHRNGFIVPLNPDAETWLEMAAFDDMKKANTRTYQDIIFEICGYIFDPHIHKITLFLTEEEKAFTRSFSRLHRIEEANTVVGVNIGAGSRWPMKRWTLDGFIHLIEKLSIELNARVILLCGPEELEQNIKMKGALRTKGIGVIDGGCDNTLRQFISLIDLCDLVVTGDTMAMHIAIGLEKKVVALFGPTSAAEIELYGHGVKVTPEMACLCCYKQKCDVRPNCMESIKADEVFDSVKRCLSDDHAEKEEDSVDIGQHVL